MPMFYDGRPTVFVLAATDNGTMITSYMDWEKAGEDGVLGVTVELFNKSSYDPTEIEFICQMLDLRRTHKGDGMVVIDGGANIGCYTLPLAKHMTGWGEVIAFEPQKRLFGALAGNITLNNCFNADFNHAALGAVSGVAGMELIDYTKPRNLGGVRITAVGAVQVPIVAIDDRNLTRLDLLKLDVEGMEIRAIAGAALTIERCMPLIYAEHIICGEDALRGALEPLHYQVQPLGMNVLAMHRDDPMRKQVQFVDKSLAA
jgi:FkbM family methyltransferase